MVKVSKPLAPERPQAAQLFSAMEAWLRGPGRSAAIDVGRFLTASMEAGEIPDPNSLIQRVEEALLRRPGLGKSARP